MKLKSLHVIVLTCWLRLAGWLIAEFEVCNYHGAHLKLYPDSWLVFLHITICSITVTCLILDIRFWLFSKAEWSGLWQLYRQGNRQHPAGWGDRSQHQLYDTVDPLPLQQQQHPAGWGDRSQHQLYDTVDPLPLQQQQQHPAVWYSRPEKIPYNPRLSFLILYKYIYTYIPT